VHLVLHLAGLRQRLGRAVDATVVDAAVADTTPVDVVPLTVIPPNLVNLVVKAPIIAGIA